jgi:RNA 3'-terminal phosphate cyclase (ATP)
MADLLEIDGSQGEGGGQVLRSALALSILTGTPFRLVNVRANRRPPGLKAQHAACVQAAATVCGGRFTGGKVGSDRVEFTPGEVVAGTHRFAVGTAGATSLVLHTVYLPLALKGAHASELSITGGTHGTTCPVFEYLRDTWAGLLRLLGLSVDVAVTRPGFYPRGGGELRAVVHPNPPMHGLTLDRPATVTSAAGFAAVAGLPRDIAERMARRLRVRLSDAGFSADIDVQEWTGGPGAVCGLTVPAGPAVGAFSAVGERGRPAEAVADEAVDAAIAFARDGGPVDPHAADQLVLPLAFCDPGGSFRTSEVTRHLTTNIDVIRRFTCRDISVDAEEGEPGTVRVAAV